MIKLTKTKIYDEIIDKMPKVIKSVKKDKLLFYNIFEINLFTDATI